MSAITCPKCDGDIEYVTETVTNGDGPWLQSYLVASVLVTSDDETKGAATKTTCGCVWQESDFEELDRRATEAAHEPQEGAG